MIFRQLIHDDPGCASWLIGDEDAGVAAVVDPKFEIEEHPRARAPLYRAAEGRLAGWTGAWHAERAGLGP